MKTPLEKFWHWVQTQPDSVYLHQPYNGAWTEFSWARAADEVLRITSAIREKNFPPGSNIAILSKNCAHWLLADYAIWASGHVSVPIYANSNANSIRYILEHCDAKLIFVGKLDKYDHLQEAIPEKMPRFNFPYKVPTKGAQWDELVKSHKPFPEKITCKVNDVATIIYTSGTTGVPKGVVHSFASYGFAGDAIMKTIDLKSSDRFFSYLPLAHVAERLLNECAVLWCGGTIYFAESLDTFTDNLKTAQPTIFLGVPRIWVKFQQGVLEKVPQKKLNILLALPIIGGLIRKKIKKALGLNATRLGVTGAAPASASLLAWWKKLGIPIGEAYGLTENFGFTSITRPSDLKFGTVGQAWPGVELKVVENQEVISKSPTNMLGYYRDLKQTQETIKNGYLHTGDQGQLDAQGNLKITGRIKDIFKTEKGKYIVPGPIEEKFSRTIFFEAICLVGMGMPQPMMLAVPSESAKKMNKDHLNKELTSLLNDVNSGLEAHEKIKSIVIVKDAWTVDNELITPSLKVKRQAVEKYYGDRLQAWYDLNERVIIETDMPRKSVGLAG